MRVADGERLRCLEISYGRTRVVVVPVVALVFTEVEVCVSEVVCCFRCSSVTGEQVSQRGHTLFPLVQVVRAAVGSRLQYRQRQTNASEVQQEICPSLAIYLRAIDESYVVLVET